MSTQNFILGTQLRDDDRRSVLSAYVHRFTRDHVPQWARSPRPDGTPYQVQFASDADWLANTLFAVTKAGRLDKLSKHCQSTPTWPDGKDIKP